MWVGKNPHTPPSDPFHWPTSSQNRKKETKLSTVGFIPDTLVRGCSLWRDSRSFLPVSLVG